MQNMKRKRGRCAYNNAINSSGNYTPSDSDSDNDDYQLSQRKVVKTEPMRVPSASIELNVDDDDDNVVDEDSNESRSSSDQVINENNQLLHDALQKLQELENELAELNDADHDSGHDEDEDDDEPGSSILSLLGNLEDRNLLQQRQFAGGEAEALGFAFCVKETFEYLAMQGVKNDNPVVGALRHRFLGKCDKITQD